MASQLHKLDQQVRILVCPQNHPDHVGQVGTAASYNRRTAALRVYVGMGICQATVVEPVAEMREDAVGGTQGPATQPIPRA